MLLLPSPFFFFFLNIITTYLTIVKQQQPPSAAAKGRAAEIQRKPQHCIYCRLQTGCNSRHFC